MSDSLIEQVQKCADLQKKWGTTSCFILDANTNARFDVDFPALLAHMQAQQAVVEIAVAINQGYKNWVYEISAKDKREHALAEEFFHALDAALEKVKS